MDLGELVFTLNVRSEGLMAGANAAMAKMGELAGTQDAAGRSAGVLEARLGILGRMYAKQRDAVRAANEAYAQSVAAHGATSNEAKKAEEALTRELAALQKLGAQMNQASNAATTFGQNQKTMSMETITAYTAMAAAAQRGLSAIFDAIEAGIDAINRYKTSLIGLTSVASGKGVDLGDLRGAMNSLVDGFFDASAAATSFKNLLSRGFSLDQAVDVITRLKDAAATGRQASMSLAQAVMSATEGLKNEMSILVDNAGVTKNVSIMWKEYAKQIGVGADSLTVAQKVQAEYNGIMEETRHMVGNLAKVERELPGIQSQTAMSGELLARAYGESMTPAVAGANRVWGFFLGIAREVISAMPGVASGVTVAGIAMAGFAIISKVVILFQNFRAELAKAAASATGFAATMNAAMPWLLALSALVGVAVAAYTDMTRAQEEARKRAEELAAARQAELKESKASVDRLEELGRRYEELNQKREKSYSDARELRSIEQELAEKYGVTIDTLGSVASAYDTVTEAIRRKRTEMLADMQATLDYNLASAKNAMVQAFDARDTSSAVKYLEVTRAIATEYANMEAVANGAYISAREVMDSVIAKHPELSQAVREYWELWQSTVQGGGAGTGMVDLMNSASEMMGKVTSDIQDGEKLVEAASGSIAAVVAAAMDKVERSVENADIPALFLGQMRSMVKSFDFAGGINVDAFMEKYAAALQNADVGPALKAMEEMNQKILGGLAITPEDGDKYIKAYYDLFEVLVGGSGDKLLPSYTSDWRSFFDGITNGIFSLHDAAKGAAPDWDAFWESIRVLARENLQSMGVDGLIESAEKASKAFADFTEDAAELKKVRAALALLGTDGVDLSKPYEQQSLAVQEALDILREYYNVNVNTQTAFDLVSGAAASQKAALDASRASMVDYYDQLIKAMEALKAAGKQSDGTALTEREISALQAAIDAYSVARLSLAQALSTKSEGFSKEFFDTAIKGAGDLSGNMRELAGEMESVQAKLDVLRTLDESWGDLQSDVFKGAMADAEKMYGYRFTSQQQVVGQLKDEQAEWGNLYILWQAQSAAYNTTIALLETIRASFADGTAEAAQLDLVIGRLKEDAEGLTRAANYGWKFQTESGIAIGALDDMKRGIDSVGNAMQSLKKRQDSVTAAKALVAEAKRLKDAGKDVADTWRASVSAALGYEFTGTLEEAVSALQNMGDGVDVAFKDMAGMLDEWEAAIRAAMAGEIENTLKINPNATVDTSKYEAALALINAWRALLGLPPLGGPGRSGGGGGGGNSRYRSEIEDMEHEIEMGRMSLEEQLAALEAIDARFRNRNGRSRLSEEDQRDLAERIHAVEEQIRQEAIQSDYDLLNHKKRMNQLTLQEELEMLEQIRREHQLTAEEIMEWEEMVHDVQEEIRQEAVQAALDLYHHQQAMGQLTVDQEIAMLQAIVAAHELTQEELWAIQEQIYALQTQQQQDALNEQVSAVQTAYDRIVDALRNRYAEERDAEQEAIDAQIAALQEETAAENEERRVQDFNEKKADLERRLRLSKSARERRELQAELDRLIADEELRQRQNARQEEIDALRDERQAIADRYAALMEEENLRQEALRLVMSGNLQAMADLIESYGDEWEDAGAALAEYLTNGLNSQTQTVLDAINDLLDSMAEAVNAQIGAAARGVPGANAARGITVIMNGTTIREEADVRKVAAAIYREVKRADN